MHTQHLLFAYGTLLDPQVQQMLFSRTLAPGQPALLYNWKKHTHEEYPFIVPSAGSVVKGKLLQLSPQELAAADHWEEVPQEYQREQVDVVCGQATLKVWAFTQREKKDQMLPC